MDKHRQLTRRLEEAKGRWAEELPQVLWSYHTTPHSSINETPFRLTFGTEAVISVEIEESSPRTALFQPAESKDEIRVNLDLFTGKRVCCHGSSCPKATTKISPRHFQSHDLVLRKITRTVDGSKLAPIWEGPYRITEEAGIGAYRLEHLDGKKIPRTWNTMNLCAYHS
ncbi:hypothetical protein CR513_23773, partial [Mucuna pruriens]